jgi:L-amino acid N-acyltransferase YncA
MIIRTAGPNDGGPISRIYNHYVANTIVTFEEEPVSGEQMTGRIEEVRSASLPWLVAEVDRALAGYAYASRWKGRCAYRFSVEVTVYLDPAHTGRGIGSRLFEQLLAELRQRGFRTALGGIALPNDASIALHERFGFSKAAHFEQVGFKFGRWIDVGYWQLLLQPDRNGAHPDQADVPAPERDPRLLRSSPARERRSDT